MPTFVTGGAGFIGSVVVARLQQAGRPVRCLVRDPARAQKLDCQKVTGDVRDLAALLQGMEGCHNVIHLACPSSWREIRSGQMESVVVEGTRQVLEAARRSGCARLVYVSSSLAVGGSREPRLFDETACLPPGNLVYARAKQAAERLCRESGLDVVIVNPGEVYGPNDETLVTAGNLLDFARGSPALVCHGGSSVVHVEDVAAGILAALERGRAGERYILGGDNLTVRQLAELTLAILGRPARILAVPNGLLRVVALLGSRLRIPLPFEPEVVPYATRFWFMDNTKARRELSLTFRSARETLEPTVRWLVESGRL